jgi:hypothetical protein
MGQLRLTILLLFITTISHGQERNFELKKIKFKGLEFSATKNQLVKAFGQGKKVDTNYDCGFFTNDQASGPYYQLVYADFNYIGSDKGNFYLQYVNLGKKGSVKIKYGDKELSALTTKDEFVKIFGEWVNDYFVKHTDHETFLLYSKNSDDGAVFTFKNGRLYKFEYWTPC